ncbi:nuclear transport factor 2 family protein [soil metagenome]
MHPNPDAFAKGWIDAWNRHDLEAIMTFYADELDYTSAKIKDSGINEDGKLYNKIAVREYFEKGLVAYPELYFDYKGHCVGLNSIVVMYISIHGKMSAEFFHFNKAGLVDTVMAHY